jgi:hypothetical protein
LLTRHELAWAIANQERSRLGEARGIFNAVLSDRSRVLGTEHPRTLTTLHELAWISAQEGQWERRILGEEHPDTLATQRAREELHRGRIIDARHLA